MQKIIAMSDLHISNKNTKYRKDKFGVSDLLVRQYNFAKHLAAHIKEEDAIFLFLGDLTDYTNLDPVTNKYVNMIVSELVNTGQPCIFLEGNHCVTDAENNFTVLSALDSVIDSSNVEMIYRNKVLNIGGYTFYCVPYNSNYELAKKTIFGFNENVDKKRTNIMLFHFPTTNALLDNGFDSVSGLNLDTSLTCNFDLCLGGDFHTHQKLKNNPNTYYVGAPFSLKFGEHQARGYIEVDFQTPNEYHIINHLNPFSLDIVDLEPSEVEGISERDRSNMYVRVLGEIDSSFLEGFYGSSIKKKAVKSGDIDATLIEDFEQTSFTSVMRHRFSTYGDDYLDIFEEIKSRSGI